MVIIALIKSHYYYPLLTSVARLSFNDLKESIYKGERKRRHSRCLLNASYQYLHLNRFKWDNYNS